MQLGENESGTAATCSPCCSTPRSPLAWKGSITQGVPAASPTPTMSSLAVLNAPNVAMAHSASFDEAYDSQSNTMKVPILLTDRLGGKEAWRPTHFS